MEETTRLLKELVALQQATVRLQKLSISLQAEALAYQSVAAAGGAPRAALERTVVRAVKQMRATADRVAAGRALPR